MPSNYGNYIFPLSFLSLLLCMCVPCTPHSITPSFPTMKSLEKTQHTQCHTQNRCLENFHISEGGMNSRSAWRSNQFPPHQQRRFIYVCVVANVRWNWIYLHLSHGTHVKCMKGSLLKGSHGNDIHPECACYRQTGNHASRPQICFICFKLYDAFHQSQ